MNTHSIYYPPATKLSHNRIDKYGKQLTSPNTPKEELEKANEEIGAWRASHLYPLNTFRTTLIKKSKGYDGAVVAQRLKRMSTIIKKLMRFPSMQLSTMQDVAGLRIILNNVKDAYEIKQYYSSSRVSHEIREEYDYIINPKKDGYRSIHLVFKYIGKNQIAHEYDGLLVELQIRTRLQHTWATAVEAAGIINGEKYKNGVGNKKWLSFFKLASEAFEIIEYVDNGEKYINKPPKTPQQVYKELAELDNQENILSKLINYSNAFDVINNKHINAEYYIISIHPSEHKVIIRSFKKSNYKEAISTYAELENNAERSDTDQVLVSVGDIKNLRIAYPSYFADISEFAEKINVLKELVLEKNIK